MGEMDNILGGLIVGTWGASALFAVELAWAFRYYKYFSERDPTLLKLLVAIVLAVDSVSLFAAFASTYIYTGAHWGDPDILSRQYWPVPLFASTESTVAAIVQGFLTYRYFRLSKNWLISVAILLLTCTMYGSSLSVAILVVKWTAFEDRFRLANEMKAWFIIGAGTDTCIALALTFVLRNHRTGIKSTDTIINRLMMTSLQSGCIPALFAVASFITFLSNTQSDMPNVFLFPLSHLYVLTLLYVLNIRDDIISGLWRGSVRGMSTTAVDTTMKNGESSECEQTNEK